MLEYNFNELDDDFITLWSRYLLSYDATQIAADLEKLAELGQINAIQSYYLFLADAGKTETNREIDKRLNESVYSRNFNHLLAQAHRIWATDVQDRVSLNDLIATCQLENAQIDIISEKLRHYSDPYLSKSEEKAKASLEKNLNDWVESHQSTITELESSKFWQKQNAAIDACIAQANASHDAVVFERYFELVSSSVYGHLNDAIENRALKHDAKVARKELAKRRKANPSPVLDFTLAKNLIFFSKKEKYNVLGRQILTGLANRELSKTLTEYQLKGFPTLANSVFANASTDTDD